MTFLPAKALERAQTLSALVHGDGDRRDVEALLTPLARGDLYALAVSLAAMVDVDRSCADLLAWSEPPRYVRLPGLPAVLAVANYYGITLDELTGPSRTAKLVEARHVAMWLCVRHCRMPLAEVGRLLGRDHSTVLHGARRVDAALVGGRLLVETGALVGSLRERQAG